MSIEAPRAHVTREGSRVAIDHLTPGLDAAIEIRGKNGGRTQIVVLSREQARNVWKAPLGGRERLVYSPADVYFEGDRVHLNSTDPAKVNLAIFPDSGHAPEGFRRTGAEGIFARYSASVTPVEARAEVRLIHEPATAGPVRMGKEVAMAPEESAFEGAARWTIHVPDVKSPAIRQVLLRIAYQGDIARIYAGNRLITDDFYHGSPWEIGLEGIPAGDLKQGLELEILPLRADAPIYLANEARPSIPPGGQVARISEVRLMPVYQAVAAVHP
jgi:beta-galactosidase